MVVSAIDLFDQLFKYDGWKLVLDGLKNTLIVALLGLAIGIVIGTLIAFVKVSPNTWLTRVLNVISNIYVGFFRGTPILVQLLLFYYALPMITGIQVNQLVCAIITFGLNSGAYMSEMLRGGLNSVDKGQAEAGRSLGFSHFGTLFRIVLPQAIKNIVPTMGNELISLIKETSIISFIGATDLTKVFQELAGSTYAYISSYLILAAIYLVIISILTVAVRQVERRMRRSDLR